MAEQRWGECCGRRSWHHLMAGSRFSRTLLESNRRCNAESSKSTTARCRIGASRPSSTAGSRVTSQAREGTSVGGLHSSMVGASSGTIKDQASRCRPGTESLLRPERSTPRQSYSRTLAVCARRCRPFSMRTLWALARISAILCFTNDHGLKRSGMGGSSPSAASCRPKRM